MLHLVRHGRPLLDATVPAARWELDPAGFDDVWALRDRLPQGASWFTSPEPKAVATAQLLTDAEVGIVEGLREQHRGPGGWVADLDDFVATVARAFADPAVAAHEGWEPLAHCRERVVGTVRGLLAAEPAGRDVVLVGHGTAWTIVVAELRAAAPDLDLWRGLGMPGVLALDPGSHALGSGG